jgi:hypothetical protein
MATKVNPVSDPERYAIARFVHRQVGSEAVPLNHVKESVEFAVGPYTCQGGLLMLARLDGELQGVAVINKTHMSKFFPENLLTYLAVAPEAPDSLPQQLLSRVQEVCKGQIGYLHKAGEPIPAVLQSEAFRSGWQILHRQ